MISLWLISLVCSQDEDKLEDIKTNLRNHTLNRWRDFNFIVGDCGPHTVKLVDAIKCIEQRQAIIAERNANKKEADLNENLDQYWDVSLDKFVVGEIYS